MPADVRIETYVRAKSMEAIEATHKKVDAALKAGGDAVGAQTIIETLPSPSYAACNEKMNELFVANARNCGSKSCCLKRCRPFYRSGDLRSVAN